MAVHIDDPLVRDIEALLTALAEFIPELRYAGYICEDAEVRTTLYVAGWSGEGRLPGCCTMGISKWWRQIWRRCWGSFKTRWCCRVLCSEQDAWNF